MGQALGQPVVVENRGGASGSIGCAAVAQAAADGLTLLADASPHAANATLLKGLSFDYASAFAPLTQLVVNPLVLVVNAAVPARTLAEFVAWVRAQAQPPAYASSGIAAAPHQAAALWLQRAGLRATHVPYRGSAPAMAGLLAGETAFTFSTLPQAVPLVQEGRLRALAVATAERLPNLAEVPTVAEQGFPGFDRAEAASFWAPMGTPAAAVARVQRALVAALAEPEVRSRLETIGMTPVGSTPAELAASSAEYRTQAAELIRREGIRLE